MDLDVSCAVSTADLVAASRWFQRARRKVIGVIIVVILVHYLTVPYDQSLLATWLGR